jgi:hypothetical protein
LARRKIIVGAAFAIAATLTMAGVLAFITSTRTIPSSGTIRGINLSIYWDDTFLNETTSIGWGSLDKGTSVNRTIYVRNTGTVPMTLSMTVGNWSPSGANSYLTVAWDQEGNNVTANSYVPAQLMLSVSPSFTNGTAFSVDITITGTY